MKLRPWGLPVLSFVVLLGLVGGNGYWVMRRARSIHDERMGAHHRGIVITTEIVELQIERGRSALTTILPLEMHPTRSDQATTV